MGLIILGEYCKKLGSDSEISCDCNKFAGHLDPTNFEIVSKLLPAHEGCDCVAEARDTKDAVYIHSEDMTRVEWVTYQWIPVSNPFGKGQLFMRGELTPVNEIEKKNSEWKQFQVSRDMKKIINDEDFEEWVKLELEEIKRRLTELESK